MRQLARSTAELFRSPAGRYATAVVAIVLATLFRRALQPLLGDSLPFATVFLAVLISAWYGGLGPGLLAALLGGIASALFLLPESPNVVVTSFNRQAGLVLYFAVSVGIALLGGAMRSAQNRATALASGALAKREELHTTLHSIGDAVIVTDGQGRITTMNPVAEMLTGWPTAEAVRQPVERVFAVLGEMSQRPLDNPVEQVLGHGRAMRTSEPALLVARDGTSRPIDESAAPIRDQQGNLIGVVLVFRDATERRGAERQLRESEERFRALADTAPVLIWMAGPDKRCDYFNRPWLEFTGRTLAEERGDGWTEGIHSADRERCLAIYDSYFDLRQPFQMEFRLRRHDGDYRWLLNSGVPRFDVQGKLLGYIGSCIDITDRKRAADALRERELRYRYVSRAANDAIRDWDVESDEVTWNEGLQKIFGYTWEQVGLTSDWWKAQLHPDDRERVEAALKAQLAGDREIWSDEYRFQRGDGGYAYVVDRGYVLRNDQGQAVRMISSMLNLTERRHAEERLRESEERLRLSLESGRMGVWDWNLRTGRVEWSDGLAAIHGLKENEFRGTIDAFRELVHPDDRPLLEREISRAIEQRGSFDIEFRNVWPDGSIHWMAGKAKVFCDDNGEPLRMVGVGLDISARKRLEEQLHWRLEDLAEAEARVRSIVDHVVDGLVTIDSRGIIESFNNSAEQIFGWSAADAVGQPLGLLLAEPQVAPLESLVGARRELAGRRSGGATFPMELSVSEFHVSNQRYFTAIVRDITERKRREQIDRFLADASAALAGVIDHKSTLSRVARMAVPFFADWCAIDMLAPSPAGEGLAEVESRLERLAVAHSDPAKVALAHEVHRRWPPKLDPTATHGLAHILRTGRSELVPDINDEMLIEQTSDAELLAQLRQLGLRSYMGVPLIVQGKTVGAISFIAAESGRRYDVTDLAAAEDLARRAGVAIENAELYQALRESDRKKDEFLAVLAHELRNPLAPIRNALHILKLSGHDAATVAEVRNMAERQVQHLTRLVDDLLDVSRIMRGRIDLRRERVELATVVNRAVETARPLVDAEQHALNVSLPDEPVWLEADVVRMSQVISNLISNAAKYTERGGNIWIAARLQDGQVRISVRDSGIGIAPEMLPKLFDMFVQVAPSASRSQGGLGIGLTLVKNLVEMHGGRVEARSAGLGHGSEFVITLPVVAAEVSEVAPQPEAKTNGKTRRIVVVDDNVDAANSLAVLLQLHGHEVRVAHGGPEAIELITSDPPEVVLLDIGMPHMNGYEVARRLRADFGPEQLRLVALTGWGQEQDRQRSHAAGFDHHLTKPVELSSLMSVLEAAPQPASLP